MFVVMEIIMLLRLLIVDIGRQQVEMKLLGVQKTKQGVQDGPVL